MLNNINYKDIIKDDKVMILVSGEGCANCITMLPTVNNIVEKYPQIMLHIIEVDEDTQELIEEYNIEKVPSVLLFENGNLLAKISGYQPDEIFELYVKDKFKL